MTRVTLDQVAKAATLVARLSAAGIEAHAITGLTDGSNLVLAWAPVERVRELMPAWIRLGAIIDPSPEPHPVFSSEPMEVPC